VQCSRFFLFILNIIFLLFGLVLLGFGIFIKVDKNFSAMLTKLVDTTEIEGSAIKSLAMIMIIGGVITLMISVFGCMGATCKYRCFLYMYSIILSLLIIVELAGFIMALAYRDKLEKVYNDDLYQIFVRAYRKNDTEVKAAIETLEKQLKCCGITNGAGHDYVKNNFTIPNSCRTPQTPTGRLNANGCASEIIKFLKAQLPIVAGLMGGFFLIEIFGVISAISLGVAISHTRYY